MVASKLIVGVALVALLTVAHGQERLHEKENQREKETEEVPVQTAQNPGRYIDVKKIIKNTIDMMKTYSSPENIPIIPLATQQNQTPSQTQQAPVQVSSQYQPTAQTVAYPQQTPAQIQPLQQQYAQQSLASWFAPPSQQDMKKLFHLPADIISRLASDAGYIDREATTRAPYASNSFGGFNFSLQNNDKVPTTTPVPPPVSGFVQANAEENSSERLSQQQQPQNSLYDSNVQYIPIVHQGQILLQPVRIDPNAIAEISSSASVNDQQQQQQQPIPASAFAQQQNAPFGAIGQFAVATNQVPQLAGLNKEPNQPPLPVMRKITTLSEIPALQQPVQQQQQPQAQSQAQPQTDQFVSFQDAMAKLQNSQATQPQIVRPLQYNQQQYEALYSQYYHQQQQQQQQEQQQQQAQARAPTQVFSQFTAAQEQQQQEMPKPQLLEQYRQPVHPELPKQEIGTVGYQPIASPQQQYFGNVRESTPPQMPAPQPITTTQQPPLQFESGQEIIIGGQKYILSKADMPAPAVTTPPVQQQQQPQQVNNMPKYVGGQPAPLLSGVPYIPSVPTETPKPPVQHRLVQKIITPTTESKNTTTSKSIPYQKQYTLKELEEYYNVPVIEKHDKDFGSAYPKHKQVKINFQPRVDSIVDSAPSTASDVATTPSVSDLRNAHIENLRKQFQMQRRETLQKTRNLLQREKEIAAPQVTSTTTSAPPLEVSEQQCVNIVSFAHRQRTDNVRQYAIENCRYLNNYNKNLTCENVSEYIDRCFTLFLSNRHAA